MKTFISFLLLLLLLAGNCLTQESAIDLSAMINIPVDGVSPKERTNGFSIGAGYVYPYTKNSQFGTGADFFLNYTGNVSENVALRGGIGYQFAATDDFDQFEELEGDQSLIYAKFGTLVGKLVRNNPVNYYGFGEIRAGLGMVDPLSAIVSGVMGDEKEAYFDLGFNMGGGVSFQISGNTRFFAEPVVSFATKYNSFVIRAGFEF